LHRIVTAVMPRGDEGSVIKLAWKCNY
jgi:hypothetical protein